MMALTTENHTILPVLFVALVTIAYFAVRKASSHDPREPPLAPQSIPVIGHMLGLARFTFNYHVNLRYVREQATRHNTMGSADDLSASG